MQADEVLRELRRLGSEETKQGLARYGVNIANALGIGMTDLRALAKRLGRSHALAGELWDTGVHEARILASLVDDPAAVTKAQMDRWSRAFDSWDIVDHCCGNLFTRTPHAAEMALRWSAREPEYVKRAAFAMIATLAHRGVGDDVLAGFLPTIEVASGDDRNFVRKAVNWALREIGKRNLALNAAAIESAERIKATGTRSGRWIASDALHELRSEAVQSRLRR